jgi:hypothetical protein
MERTSLDRMLFNYRGAPENSKQRRVAQHLSTSLGCVLEVPLVVISYDFFKDSFRLVVDGTTGSAVPTLDFRLKGIVGGDPAGPSDTMSIELTMFGFVANKRITLKREGKERGSDFLFVKYQRVSPAAGEWKVRGWLPDVYDEWQDVLSPDDVI